MIGLWQNVVGPKRAGAGSGLSATKRAWRKAATTTTLVALLAVSVKDLTGFAPSYPLIAGPQH